MEPENKLKIYYVTAISGVIFTMVGYGYNVWRQEKSEDNRS